MRRSYPRVYLSFDTPYIKHHETCDALTHLVNGKLTVPLRYICSKALLVFLYETSFCSRCLSTLILEIIRVLLRERDLEEAGERNESTGGREDDQRRGTRKPSEISSREYTCKLAFLGGTKPLESCGCVPSIPIFASFVIDEDSETTVCVEPGISRIARGEDRFTTAMSARTRQGVLGI